MPYIFRQTDLPKLNIQVDQGLDFEAWKEQWTSYCTLSGLAGESAATQIQALTLCLLRETLTIVNNLGLTVEKKQDASAIITAIKHQIDGHINELVEQRNLRQPYGKRFYDFLVSLRELANTCSFCSEQCAQKSIWGQIIEGSLDGDVTEELLKQSNLTLDNVRQLLPAPTTQQQVACPGSRSKPHVGGRVHCPAFEQICYHCNKTGRFVAYVRLGNLWHSNPRLHLLPLSRYRQRGMKTLNSTTLTQSHRSLPQTQHPLLKSTFNLPTRYVTHESCLT